MGCHALWLAAGISASRMLHIARCHLVLAAAVDASIYLYWALRFAQPVDASRTPTAAPSQGSVIDPTHFQGTGGFRCTCRIITDGKIFPKQLQSRALVGPLKMPQGVFKVVTICTNPERSSFLNSAWDFRHHRSEFEVGDTDWD
ncbi:hypothetical protein GGX14DRAFT_392338 [Mycena pura]|uniref:Uncharacterized protein n=1 Tax=Mycena pura TaxID=153505 RepID=A0AAD6YDF9_9AGAR|nr:hypothetical protein GGX14DRAFT_392338 [Mycena pura]